MGLIGPRGGGRPGPQGGRIQKEAQARIAKGRWTLCVCAQRPRTLGTAVLWGQASTGVNLGDSHTLLNFF